MPVIGGTSPEKEIPSPGGGSPPPGDMGDGGGQGPGNDRGRLMLLIYNARGSGAVSLEYLRGRTGFSRARLWRAFEDLEDVGYVETLEGDPRGPLSRWLDGRGSKSKRVFASTFLILTEAGRHSPELAAAIAATGGKRRGRLRLAGSKAPPGDAPSQSASRVWASGLREAPARLARAVTREWSIAGERGDDERKSRARLNLILLGFGAILLAGLPVFVLVSVAFGKTG